MGTRHNLRADGGADQTRPADLVAGTPAYLAPEVLTAKAP